RGCGSKFRRAFDREFWRTDSLAMNSDEFRQLIHERSDAQLVGLCLQNDLTPYAFEPSPASWDAFRDSLVSSFNIERTDIRVVGSARFGFSLKPGQNLKRFGDTSD